MRQEKEVMPNKSDVVRFPSLPYTMHSIRRNNETLSVNLWEDTHAGEKRWGLVFYGVNYKLLDYHRLG